MIDATTHTPTAFGWRFEKTYAQLPKQFFAAATPAAVRAPRVAIVNHRFAEELGLSLPDDADALASVFGGQVLPEGASSIAQAYAGHQFGGFTMLGDGRAILLGEHRTPSGQLVDLQFKGSGPTAYSRGGDGRAALGPMLREYIISEAMHALGIPTTRSLAVVTTGENVRRETPLPGAVLTRVAASHLRVGTFQYASATQDESLLRALADYAIDRHDPHMADHPQKYLEFVRAVIDRQAELIAKWQLVGFVHGVMNTDNMSISGETIDYGPCAFLDAYHAETVFSSIDHGGRYAYRNQPHIAQWNLARLAETLLPLIDADESVSIPLATELIHEFPAKFEAAWLRGMRKKLGIQTEHADDLKLSQDLLSAMQASDADFTNTFRGLATDNALSAFEGKPELIAWHTRWQSRMELETQPRASAFELMQSANPAIIPRNHRVEDALAAAQKNDLTVLHQLLDAIAKPYESQPQFDDYRTPPPAGSPKYRTFCGT